MVSGQACLHPGSLQRQTEGPMQQDGDLQGAPLPCRAGTMGPLKAIFKNLTKPQ